MKADKLPVEYIEADNDDGKPVVTLLGADISEAYLDDAEPSPMAAAIGRFWRRIIGLAKFGLVLLLVGGYPAMTVLGHKVDSSPIVLSAATPWYSNDTGTAMTLLGRELTVAGWASDRSWWHPQARLTALPAWQDGVTGALSEYTLLASEHASREPGLPDSDLLAAARQAATRRRVERVELHAVGRKAVDAGGENIGRPVGADVAVAKVVGDDKHDIG